MPLKIVGATLTCTPTNTRLSIVRNAAATTVSAGCRPLPALG
jgi:hypothetical protein